VRAGPALHHVIELDRQSGDDAGDAADLTPTGSNAPSGRGAGQLRQHRAADASLACTAWTGRVPVAAGRSTHAL